MAQPGQSFHGTARKALATAIAPPITGAKRLSTEQARKLLNGAKGVDSSEIEAILDEMYSMAHILCVEFAGRERKREEHVTMSEDMNSVQQSAVPISIQ
jgi:hypothetical protein